MLDDVERGLYEIDAGVFCPEGNGRKRSVLSPIHRLDEDSHVTCPHQHATQGSQQCSAAEDVYEQRGVEAVHIPLFVVAHPSRR